MPKVFDMRVLLRVLSAICLIVVSGAGGFVAAFQLKPELLASLSPAEPPASGARQPLYYRNPMGLPDTSPVPKKDSMGMDYIPVYAEDAANQDSSAVKVSTDKVQRAGVRTEPVG